MRFILALIMTCALGVGAFGVEIYFDTLSLDKVQEELIKAKEEEQKAEQRIECLRFAKDEAQNRVLTVDVIKELYELTPEEISFKSICLKQRSSLVMEGSADTRSSINQFQCQLVESPLFEDVTMEYATKRKRFKEENTAFKIKCNLTQGKDSGE